jgi:hypothetical protein
MQGLSSRVYYNGRIFSKFIVERRAAVLLEATLNAGGELLRQISHRGAPENAVVMQPIDDRPRVSLDPVSR